MDAGEGKLKRARLTLYQRWRARRGSPMRWAFSSLHRSYHCLVVVVVLMLGSFTWVTFLQLVG